MKKTTIIAYAVGLACVWAGCENTFDVSGKADNLLSVSVNSLNEQQSFNVGEKYKAELWVQRGGLGDAKGNVLFTVEPALLDSLNEADLTHYELLPPECYELTETGFAVDKPEVAGYITYDPEKILALSGYDQVKYVLPLKLSSADLPVNPDRSVALLSFKVSEPIVRIMNSGTYEIDPAETSSLDVTLGVPFTNKWNIECELLHDQSLVDEYNAANKVDFVLLPSGFYTVPETSALSPGTNSLAVSYKLNEGLLPGNYILPVRIGNIRATLDGTPSDALVADIRSSAVFNIVKLGNKIDKTGWEIVACNSEAKANLVANLIDGNDETFWHCKTKSETGWNEPPYTIVMDMKKTIRLAQIDLLNRGEANRANNIRWVEFYASRDNVNWEKIGASDFKDEFVRTRFRYYVKPAEARYLKLVIPEGHGNNCPPAAIRELDVYGLEM